MTDYATVAQALGRPGFPEAASGEIEDLLRRASGIIRADCPLLDAIIATDPPTPESEARAELAQDVCLDMVARALTPSLIPTGFTQMSQTAGPLTVSGTQPAEAASGRLYLSRVDRDRLRGRRAQRAGSVWMGKA